VIQERACDYNCSCVKTSTLFNIREKTCWNLLTWGFEFPAYNCRWG